MLTMKIESRMESDSQSTQSSRRLMSVDALRGFDILWIIGGAEVLTGLCKASGIGFLSNMEVNFDHSWGQFHFYDLIMPLFLFIVGVVMPISFGNRLRRGDTKKKLYGHIIKRVVVLYILGLIASGHLLTFDTSKMHLWTSSLVLFAGGLLKYLGPWADFVEAFAALAVLWLILYFMYRTKIFIKI
jgi:predicted acyltransferase